MKEYLFTSPKLDGELKLRYNASGALQMMELLGNWTIEQQRALCDEIPTTIEQLHGSFMKKRSDTSKLMEVKMDVSFDSFWTAYNYKLGNKEKARKIWEKLAESDKINALNTIPLYDRMLLMKQTQDKVYAERYLSQRRWENEYKYKP
jgi:hypothetical protein